MNASFDTNVIVRLFINDDESQSAAAVKALDRYDEIAMADIAIVETIYVLNEYYKVPRKKTTELINVLLEHPKINCNRALFRKALQLYVTHPALSIEDCCLAVYAHLTEAEPLLTFDKKLAAQTPHTEILR